jgi:hypothetical protein
MVLWQILSSLSRGARRKLAMSIREDDKESKEPDYDDDKEQLEEEQEKETEGKANTKQPFDPINNL